MKKETSAWLKQAEEHYQDALYLYQGSRYSSAVFLCHQALEKILKACVVEFSNKVPSKIHQLDRIAKEAKLVLPKSWPQELAEITRHFWRVRYPDFRKYVYTNKKAAEQTMDKTKEIYLWILNKLNQL
jgi:HEPN domain-containing protein